MNRYRSGLRVRGTTGLPPKYRTFNCRHPWMPSPHPYNLENNGIRVRHDTIRIFVYLAYAPTEKLALESNPIKISSLAMYLLKLFSIFSTLAPYVMAQNDPQPPAMTLLYHMEVQLGKRFSLGPVPNGQERVVIPIVGGSFKGPRLSGTAPHIH